jgi:hypothetical protein
MRPIARRSHAFRMFLATLAVAANVAAFAPPARAANVLFSDSFTGSSGAPNSTRWKTWWGTVGLHNDVLSLASKNPTVASRTYSALVTSRKAWTDYSFAYTQTTVKQLRQGTKPNTWEVGWSMFRYRDLANYYYFILKPNGWELGKKHGSDAQIFLATGSSPAARVGVTNHVRITVKGAQITIYVDGARIVTFADPHPIASGAIGVYEEDAHVHFDQTYVYSV